MHLWIWQLPVFSEFSIEGIECVHVPVYCMAGNFRGVLIFVIFVVQSQVTKIPSTKINAYTIYSHMYGRWATGGVAKISWQRDPKPFRLTSCLFVVTVIQLMAPSTLEIL